MQAEWLRVLGQLVARAALDRKHVWHPPAQMSDHEWLPMLAIARVEGAYLFDSSGKGQLAAAFATTLIATVAAPDKPSIPCRN